jgi:hypothetical protein
VQQDGNIREPRRVSGLEAMRDTIADACSRAQRKIAIYAPSLDPVYLNGSQVVGALASVCTGGSQNRIRILVDQGDRSVRDNPRLIALARRVSDCIDIRELGEETPATMEMFIVIDRMGYVHQSDSDKAQCVIDLEEPTRAGAFTNRFDRMWERSVPIGELHVLGLGR